MRKIWDKIVESLYKVGQDKWFHFIGGLIVAAFFAFLTNWSWAALISASVVGIGKEVFDYFTTKNISWKDFVATFSGGLIIFMFSLL